jgi:hypothetical protein
LADTKEKNNDLNGWLPPPYKENQADVCLDLLGCFAISFGSHHPHWRRGILHKMQIQSWYEDQE